MIQTQDEIWGESVREVIGPHRAELEALAAELPGR